MEGSGTKEDFIEDITDDIENAFISVMTMEKRDAIITHILSKGYTEAQAREMWNNAFDEINKRRATSDKENERPLDVPLDNDFRFVDAELPLDGTGKGRYKGRGNTSSRSGSKWDNVSDATLDELINRRDPPTVEKIKGRVATEKEKEHLAYLKKARLASSGSEARTIFMKLAYPHLWKNVIPPAEEKTDADVEGIVLEDTGKGRYRGGNLEGRIENLRGRIERTYRPARRHPPTYYALDDIIRDNPFQDYYDALVEKNRGDIPPINTIEEAWITAIFKLVIERMNYYARPNMLPESFQTGLTPHAPTDVPSDRLDMNIYKKMYFPETDGNPMDDVFAIQRAVKAKFPDGRPTGVDRTGSMSKKTSEGKQLDIDGEGRYKGGATPTQRGNVSWLRDNYYFPQTPIAQQIYRWLNVLRHSHNNAYNAYNTGAPPNVRELLEAVNIADINRYAEDRLKPLGITLAVAGKRLNEKTLRGIGLAEYAREKWVLPKGLYEWLSDYSKGKEQKGAIPAGGKEIVSAGTTEDVDKVINGLGITTINNKWGTPDGDKVLPSAPSPSPSPPPPPPKAKPAKPAEKKKFLEAESSSDEEAKPASTGLSQEVASLSAPTQKKPKKPKKDKDDDDDVLEKAFAEAQQSKVAEKVADRAREDAFQAILQPLRARMNMVKYEREVHNTLSEEFQTEKRRLDDFQEQMATASDKRHTEMDALEALANPTEKDLERHRALSALVDGSIAIYNNTFKQRREENQALYTRVRASQKDLQEKIDTLEKDMKAFRVKYGKLPQEFPIILKGGVVPPRSDLQQMAKQAYQPNPPNSIGNSRLVFQNEFLKFYMNGNTIIVAIRGSKDSADWTNANVRIPFNQLRSSERYINDSKTIREFKQRYPNYEYYGVAHSLGGALLDEFLADGLLERGLSYNPAVQTKDFNNSSSRNERIYHEGDPLYNTMGKMLSKKPEVRPDTRKQSWTDWIVKKIPGVGSVLEYGNKALEAHNLNQFEGGKRHFAVSATRSDPPSKFQRQLENAGIDTSSYLEEARRRAKESHYPYKLLGFASDNKHKLSIPDKNGKLVSFGAVGYGDFLIYSHQEEFEKVPKGTADAKRRAFQHSHQRIKGDWRSNPFSPNNLALKILW